MAGETFLALGVPELSSADLLRPVGRLVRDVAGMRKGRGSGIGGADGTPAVRAAVWGVNVGAVVKVVATRIWRNSCSTET